MLYPVARIISDTPTHLLGHTWGRLLSLPADVLEILEFLGPLPASFSFLGLVAHRSIDISSQRARGLMLGVPAALRAGCPNRMSSRARMRAHPRGGTKKKSCGPSRLSRP